MYIAVNYNKRKSEAYPRAALVESMEGLPDAVCLPVNEVVDVLCLNCLHSFKGVSGQAWARRWLFGKGSSAYKMLSKVPVAMSEREITSSVEDIRAEVARACDPRKIGLGAKQRRLCNIL